MCKSHRSFYFTRKVVTNLNIDGKEVYGIIYKITNTANGKCYIGQTANKKGFNGRYDSSGCGAERVYRYLRREQSCGRYYDQHLLSAFEKYGVDSFIVDTAFDTAANRDELDEKEIYYIEYFDSYNNGYNKTLGGERGCGEAQPKGKDNPLSVAVCQLSLDGKLIKIWDSLADIRRDSNFNVPNIEWTCRGLNSQSYGYLWVFAKDYDPDKHYEWFPAKNARPVVLLDDNNNLIKEYKSIIIASNELHIDRQTIRSSCNNRYKKPKYNFKYKDEYMKYIGEQRLSGETSETTMQ